MANARDPESANRRGCFIMAALAALVLALFLYLGLRLGGGDRMQANEALSAATQGNAAP